MNCIKANLPKELEFIEIETFADCHIGDRLIDWKLLKKRIEDVRVNKNRYAILNGDLMDNATCQSLGDTYEAELNPNEQMQKVIQTFEPIKDKILSVTGGNHEYRTKKQTGIDLTQNICYQLGIFNKYHPISNLLFLRVGFLSKRLSDNRQVLYVIYHTHGSGGGRRPGSKANRLEDMMSKVDADIYIHSHTHTPMTFKNATYRISMINSSVEYVERLAINTGAYIDYGGYGEIAEYNPVSKSSPILILNGREKKFQTIL